MATLYITEFAYIGAANGAMQCAQQPPIAEQTLAIGGATVASAAFNAKTKFIRLHTDATCSVVIGATPVAAATKMRMAAGQTEYFGVPKGAKVAVITNV